MESADTVFEDVFLFTYLGTTKTNQNYIREEVYNKLNLGNAVHHMLLV
jgi:hypothetical protein